MSAQKHVDSFYDFLSRFRELGEVSFIYNVLRVKPPEGRSLIQFFKLLQGFVREYFSRIRKIHFPPGQSVIINDGFEEIELETSTFVIDCDNGSVNVVGHERIPFGGLKDEKVSLEGKIVGGLPEGLLDLFNVRVFEIVVDFTIEEPTGRTREVLNRPVLDRPMEKSGIRLKIGDQTVHLRLAEIFPYGGRSFPYGDIQLGEAEGGFFSIVLKNPPGAE